MTKGNNKISFYSLPEFKEWKEKTENFATWRVKYYKGESLLHVDLVPDARFLGLGTSDMNRHKIKFNYGGAQDDNAITLAFIKKKVEERKEWLAHRPVRDSAGGRQGLGLAQLHLHQPVAPRPPLLQGEGRPDP